MFHTSNITTLKQKSGAKRYAGCVGKTTLDRSDPLYTQTVRMAEILVQNNIGVVHGGYEDGRGGGTMQAYAEGANNIIQSAGLHPNYNIGIPESRFDKKRGVDSRTGYNTVFCDPLPHMDLRCGVLLDAVDLLVVNPLAGNGTLREVFTMYERNDIHKPNNLGTGKISPIIFFGDKRKQLFNTLNLFAIGTPIHEDANIHFVDTLEKFESLIKNISIDYTL